MSGKLLQKFKNPSGLPLPATVGVKSCRNHCSSCTTSIAGCPPICALKKSGTCTQNSLHQPLAFARRGCFGLPSQLCYTTWQDAKGTYAACRRNWWACRWIECT